MTQLSKTNYKALYGSSGTTFPDNTTGDISESDLRQFGEDSADSLLFVGDGVDTDLRFSNQVDFIGVISQSAGSSSGTASALSFSNTDLTNSTEKALGVLAAITGTDTNGRSGWPATASTLLLGLGYTIKLRFRLALSALSDGTDTYTVYVGLGDSYSASGDNTNGCYFRYTHGTNSGKWEAVTSGTSTRTATDTGVSPTATVFQIFTITATDSSVTFDIDGTEVSNTTNLPDGASEFFKLDFKIEKSAGSNSRTMYLDWYDILITRPTHR